MVPDEVKKASRCRKGYWRMSSNRIVQMALTSACLQQQGVPYLRELSVRFKYGDQANA